jgi:hypothetical protein
MSLLTKILIATGLMFSLGCTAHAHPRQAAPHASRVTVSFHWAWVDGRWSHGHYTKGHYAKRDGRHPRAGHPDWHWIDGRWVGHGPHRHWVPGHWKRTRRA